MSWNGSGTFNRTKSWVADKAAGLDISSSRMDDDTNDIASAGFGNCLTRDGQGIATANLPMGAFRHTNVGDGVARSDYASVGQSQDAKINWVAAGGTADAITATYSPAVTTLVDGALFFFRATAANATTTPTFAPNGLTAHTITRSGGAALVAGDIPGNLTEIILRYNLANTRYELLNPEIATTYKAGSVTNAALANMAAYTLKGNNSNASAAPGDFTIDALTAKATPVAADEVPIWDVAGTAMKKATLANIVTVATPLRGYLSGLTLSGGGSQTLTINAGETTSDDNATRMTLGSNYTKTFASWVVGSANGGLDTGTVAINTWYHVYIIERTDTGVVDVLISLSATAPTLPTNYTKQRRIGSIKTDATPNIIPFFQNGDEFMWSTMPALDINGTAMSATAATVTVAVPTGIRVQGIFNASVVPNLITTTGFAWLLSSLDVADTAPGVSASPLGTVTAWLPSSSAGMYGNQARVWTNTSAQIRHRGTVSSASITTFLQTIGWFDMRGRFN